jgi:hypothetical protein
MSRLKDENTKKCVSLLKEFIDEASTPGKKKEIAIIALGHLQKIMAGTGADEPLELLSCTGRPRAYST